MLQVIVNGLMEGMLFALIAVSFQVIYLATRFFHVGHAVAIVVGGYAGFVAHVWLQLPLGLSLAASGFIAALYGLLSYLAVFLVFRRKRATPKVLLIVSLGLYVAVVNVFALGFGSETRLLGLFHGSTQVAGVWLPSTQVFGSVVAAVLLAGLLAWLRTGLGRSLRAIGGDEQLAMVQGVHVERLVFGSFVLGSALAGVAGFLLGSDVGVHPEMALLPLMLALVGLIVGGLRSTWGAIVGTVSIGVLRQLASWTLGAHWQDAAAFAVLVGFLLFWPNGVAKRSSPAGAD